MAAEDGYEKANVNDQVPLSPIGDTDAPSFQESRPSVGATLFATTRLLSKAHQTKRCDEIIRLCTPISAFTAWKMTPQTPHMCHPMFVRHYVAHSVAVETFLLIRMLFLLVLLTVRFPALSRQYTKVERSVHGLAPRRTSSFPIPWQPFAYQSILFRDGVSLPRNHEDSWRSQLHLLSSKSWVAPFLALCEF